MAIGWEAEGEGEGFEAHHVLGQDNAASLTPLPPPAASRLPDE